MKIQVNGASVSTTATTVCALRAEYLQTHPEQAASILTILNGFQTNEDRPLQEDDTIFFIAKDSYPSEEELRCMLYARHTPHVQEHLEKGHVAIAGLGGLGSNIAILLARTGVGHLHLIDFDIVEPSNLNRQQYRISHLGQFKTEALASEIAEINPYITVTTDTTQITSENLASLFTEDAIICEAFDVPENKSMLVTGILTSFSDKIVVSASGMAGYDDANRIHTRKLNDRLYLCGDETTAAAEGCGLMAPRVAVCAAHQANLVLQLLVQNTI